MKRFVLAAFLKALVITVGFDLICVIYGFISNQPYVISFAGGVICFLVLILAELIECSWKRRKGWFHF